jgi:hypothetical protein
MEGRARRTRNPCAERVKMMSPLLLLLPLPLPLLPLLMPPLRLLLP